MSGALRVLIGITGGIAAYKIPLLVRLLRKNGCEVKTVLTNAAMELVGAGALRTLSGNPVYTDQDAGGRGQYDMDHIRLSEWADVFVISPATANTIAKMACGVADNLLTALALSIYETKIIVAPAMNCVMWQNKAVQANVGTLRSRGVTVLPVEEGELACGVSGPGRMLGIEVIAERVMSRCAVGQDLSAGGRPLGGAGVTARPDSGSADGGVSRVLAGKNVLISSGPTEEPIDPVRVITNRSSGRMGAALAMAALRLGARVTVVSGPAAEPLPEGADVVRVTTAAEMEREMSARFGASDVCVMAAAVSDYRPVDPSGAKIHKRGGNLTLELTPNPDIIAKLGASKSPGQVLVGFALEDTDADISRAKEKMVNKNCDIMVFNKVGMSLGGEGTEVTLLLADGSQRRYPAVGKPAAAGIILEEISAAVLERER